MRRKDKEVQFSWKLLFSDANTTQIRPQNLCDKRDNGQVHCTRMLIYQNAVLLLGHAVSFLQAIAYNSKFI